MTKILLQDIHGNSLKVVYEFFKKKKKVIGKPRYWKELITLVLDTVRCVW